MFSKKGILFIKLKLTSVAFFTLLYWVVENYIEKNPKKKATLFDCFSFSILTQTTIGYGIPESIADTKSPLFEAINILHMSSIFFILALVL
jgi:hypothetical protein|tara:strand:+ start:846 stop:1118 length:273 start_codon:yes stop_codon:yes gene_type:complete